MNININNTKINNAVFGAKNVTLNTAQNGMAFSITYGIVIISYHIVIMFTQGLYKKIPDLGFPAARVSRF